MRAQTATPQIAPEGYPPTEVCAYDRSGPGPELRRRQGTRLRQRPHNGLIRPTTVHWNGLQVFNSLDGVPDLTQDPVRPGESFACDVVAPDAGTYWYHAHAGAPEQVGRGLHGVLIVEEDDRPAVDRDLTLVVDDWRVDAQTGQLAGDFGQWHDGSHAGRDGNPITTNGQHDDATPLHAGARLCLRPPTTANARIFAAGLSGPRGRAAAQGGMPLPRPLPLGRALEPGPGQRADIIADVTVKAGDSAHLVRLGNGKPMPRSRFPVGPGKPAGGPGRAPCRPIRA